jgi:flavin-binding protein dodecin
MLLSTLACIQGLNMNNRVYQIVELVGTSEVGIEEAINNAIAKAAALHGKLDWFEVIETRGFIDGNKTKYYQVHLKIGCHAH